MLLEAFCDLADVDIDFLWRCLFRVFAGWIGEEGLGEFELRIMLEEQLGPIPAGATDGWEGDRYVLLEDASGRRTVAWASVWADQRSRDRVAGHLERLAQRLGVARVESSLIDGVPAVLLLVNGAPAPQVSLGSRLP